MNDSCYLVFLDLNSPVAPPPLTVKKGDTGRTLQFLLKTNSTPYVISSDCYAVFTAKKPDGTILYNSCDIRNNVIFYTFTAQTCSVPGEIPCELRLYGSDDKLITSAVFTLVVEDTLYNDGDVLESVSEVSALTNLITKATDLISDVEQKLADNAYADAHSAVCYTSQDLTTAQKSQARANISAAPSGYGLGASAAGPITSTDVLDATVANGWYSCQLGSANLAGVIVNYGSVFVRNVTTTNEVIQELMPSFTNIRLRRTRNSSLTWNPWECENPPMEDGVEYRTTERHNGTPVYVKTFDIGAASTKDIALSVPGVLRLIRMETRVSEMIPLPYMNTVAHASAYSAANTIHVLLTIEDNFVLKGENTKCTIHYCKL